MYTVYSKENERGLTACEYSAHIYYTDDFLVKLNDYQSIIVLSRING